MANNRIENVPVIIGKVESMKDSSMKVSIYTRDAESLTDDAISYIMRQMNKELRMTLSEDSVMFPKQGSKAQELRNIIFLLHQKKQELGTVKGTFDEFYEAMMNNIISKVSDKIACEEADFIAKNQQDDSIPSQSGNSK